MAALVLRIEPLAGCSGACGITKAERIKAQVAVETILADLGVSTIGSGKQRMCRCPLPGHEDRKPSCSVNVESGLWYCHACQQGGDVISFYALHASVTNSEAIREMANRYGIQDETTRQPGGSRPRPVPNTDEATTAARPEPPPDARRHTLDELRSRAAEIGLTADGVYEYRDEQGVLLFVVIRCQSHDGRKTFRQHKAAPDTSRGEPLFFDRLHDARRVLYGLDMLASLSPSSEVFIVEGEEDVDRLHKLGLAASCNPMGAGKWDEEYSSWLAERRLKAVVIPDNDGPGRKHAEAVAASLAAHDVPVRVLRLPDLPERGDVSDWLDAGGTVDQLRELAAQAQPWETAPDEEYAPTPADELFYDPSLDGVEAVVLLGKAEIIECKSLDGGKRKILIVAVIQPGDHPAAQHAGQQMEVWMNLPSGKPTPKHKFHRCWSVVNGAAPTRRDRMSLRIFEGATVKVRLGTSRTGIGNRPKPEVLWTTVISDIIALSMRPPKK